MRKWLIILFISLLPLVCYSAPGKPAVTGTYTTGQTVTITATSIGSHADYDSGDANKLCFTWENFESTTDFVNMEATTDGWIPTCCTSDCNADWLVGTTGNRTNSTKWARRVTVSPHTANCNIGGMKFTYPNATSYSNVAFISYWMLVPTTTESGKNYRQWGGDSGANTDIMYFDVGGSYTGGTQRGWTLNEEGIHIMDGTWHRFDYYQDSATHMTSYIDGVADESGNLLHNSNGYFQAVIGSGHDYGNGNDAATNYYAYDDVFIDFTLARVEIGNANTWAACTHKEIQIPKTWTSGTGVVTVSFNAGSFANGTTVYAYVVDSAGGVSPASDGFQIAGSGSDTTPPTVTSATINTAGTTLTLAMSESVTNNYTTTVPTLSMNGGAVTATCNSCSSGTSLTYTLSRTIQQSETGTYSWNVATNGVEDAAGNDLVDISGAAVTNSSTVVPTAPTSVPTIGVGGFRTW